VADKRGGWSMWSRSMKQMRVQKLLGNLESRRKVGIT
jgi:hypothetical protein